MTVKSWWVVASLALLAWTVGAAAEPTAKEIIEKADDLMRGETSFSELTMKITTPRYERELSMKSWTAGRDKAFIVVTSPAKDAGVAFLKEGRQMWNYLPNVERTVKIPPSMMSQSWMGSDFSNSDLSRADTFIVDFTHAIVGTEEVAGQLCWKIELNAKPDAPVVWTKILVWAAKDTYIMVRAQYFDEDGQVARTFEADRIVDAGNRRVATHWVMTNHKKPGNRTEMTFDKIQFDLKIPPDTFSTRNLTRGAR